jgi:hypothetical protein
MRWSSSLAVSMMLLALPSSVGAQTAGDTATARALFEEATKALDAGDWAGACPKFDASFAAKATVSTLLNIAKCHDHAGKLTLAADDYQRALTLNQDTLGKTRKKELEEYATDALRRLRERIPKLRLVANDAPAGLEVKRDGVAVAPTALGIALPVDPGPHAIVASAPGRKTQTYEIVVAEKAEQEITIVLVAEAAPPPPAPTPATPGPMAAQPPSPPPPSPSPKRVPAWAWATGTIGLALGGVAIGFAIDGSQANCGGPCFSTKFTQGDVDALNRRRHLDLGLGLALGGTGAVGIALGAWGIGSARGNEASPRARETEILVATWIASERAGLALRGGF